MFIVPYYIVCNSRKLEFENIDSKEWALRESNALYFCTFVSVFTPTNIFLKS